jgi:adrenodoxin-NADP+ reductase
VQGVLSAREFVWWYNGHPDCTHLPVDLSRVESVAVCGVGNVALDCARVLLRPWGELSVTDIASHAVEQLKRSRLKEVRVAA